MNSKNYTRVGKGFLIAIAGAALTYIVQIEFDFGTWTPVAVAIASALVNWGRVYLGSLQN